MRAVSGNSHNPQQEPSSLSGPARRSDLRIASPRAAVAFSGLALADSARKSFRRVLQRIIRFLQNSDVRNSDLGKSDLGCAADASKRTALTSAILILAISSISARAQPVGSASIVPVPRLVNSSGPLPDAQLTPQQVQGSHLRHLQRSARRRAALGRKAKRKTGRLAT
jgi:hypothetical protein